MMAHLCPNAPTTAELMMNAVKCDVPHRFIMETMTGKKEMEDCEHCEEHND